FLDQVEAVIDERQEHEVRSEAVGVAEELHAGAPKTTVGIYAGKCLRHVCVASATHRRLRERARGTTKDLPASAWLSQISNRKRATSSCVRYSEGGESFHAKVKPMI